MSNEYVRYLNDMAETLKIEWIPPLCVQAFYAEFFQSNCQLGFLHRGHEYFVTWLNIEEEQSYVVYHKNLRDVRWMNDDSWDNCEYERFESLPDLVFSYKLEDDGRSIAEYINECNGLAAPLFPEPVDEVAARRAWNH